MLGSPANGLTGSPTLGLQEIQDLSSVSVPEHINSNRTARAAQEQRYPVKLTQYGLHLLMHFLQSAKLFQILNIVNRRVDIQVISYQQAALTPPCQPLHIAELSFLRKGGAPQFCIRVLLVLHLNLAAEGCLCCGAIVENVQTAFLSPGQGSLLG